MNKSKDFRTYDNVFNRNLMHRPKSQRKGYGMEYSRPFTLTPRSQSKNYNQDIKPLLNVP